MVTTAQSLIETPSELQARTEASLPALNSAEKLVVSVQLKPERINRLTTDEEAALGEYGFDVRYKLGVECAGSESSFFTVPVLPETQVLKGHERMCGYVYCRPTQGRVSSINSADGYFHGIKGNGMSESIHRRAGIAVPWYNTDGPYTFDGHGGFLGLLSEADAVNTQKFIEENTGLFSGSVLDIIYPQELPNVNYALLSIYALQNDKNCLGVFKEFGVPVFLERKLLSPATLADCLVLPFGTTGAQNVNWIRFLGYEYEESIGRVHYLSDDIILKKLQLIRQNAIPYIYSFLLNHPDISYSDMSKFGLEMLLKNYAYLLNNNLSHSSLHTQNVRLLGEFSDVSELIDSCELPQRVRKSRQRKDFISIYNAYLLQSIIFGNRNIQTPQELHEQTCASVDQLTFFNFNTDADHALKYWLENVTRVRALAMKL